MINGKIHYKWSFSIAMLNYQRVYMVAVYKRTIAVRSPGHRPVKPESVPSVPPKDLPNSQQANLSNLGEVEELLDDENHRKT